MVKKILKYFSSPFTFLSLIFSSTISFKMSLLFLTCVSVATRPHVMSAKKLLETSYKHYSIQLKTDKGRYEGTFLVGLISNRSRRLKFFGHEWGAPSQSPSHNEKSWSPSKENPEEWAWSGYCNNFESNKFAVFKVKNGK